MARSRYGKGKHFAGPCGIPLVGMTRWWCRSAKLEEGPTDQQAGHAGRRRHFLVVGWCANVPASGHGYEGLAYDNPLPRRRLFDLPELP